MARAGRKPKAGPREASGRLQRLSRAEMKLIEQSKREGEKRIVLMQPHRKGDGRQECASAFGRFILRMPQDRQVAMKHVGDDYATAVRSWRAAKGVPSQARHGEAGAGVGPSDAAVARWQKAMIEADRVMTAASHDGWLYVRQMVLDEYDIGMDQDGLAAVALEALAHHHGMLSRHPFRG